MRISSKWFTFLFQSGTIFSMEKVVKSINRGLFGSIEVSPDKSLSHRAIMFASLAKGVSYIRNFLKGADCYSTLKVCRQLGVDIRELSSNVLEVTSTGVLQKSSESLDCGNSGTTMRLMSGILAGQNFESTLFGDESLSKRPMRRVINPLSQMGADIISNDGKAPLVIKGKSLKGIDYISELASAQVKSCVLLAGLFAEGKTSFVEPAKSRDHTERMLKAMGANITIDGLKVSVESSVLNPIDFTVPGDISSAAFFIVAALIVPDSDIIIKNVGMNPTRTGIIDIVIRMGGNIEIFNKREILGEPIADLRVKYSILKGVEISGADIPRLIDEIPIITILATQAEGVTVIKDAEDLRNKESDRIATMVEALRMLGADVVERVDGLTIRGKVELQGDCALESHQDHRLAMSYYVAGLISKNPIKIKGFEWIKVSFPEFEDLMEYVKKS